MGKLFLALLTAGSCASEVCSVQGRVLDPSGKPVPFAVVTLSGAVLQPLHGAASDASGVYCLPALPPGEYMLQVEARREPPAAWPHCTGCCGKTFDLAASAQTVRLTGQPVTVNIGLRRVRTYCVRGEVRDLLNRPLSRIGISVRSGVWSASVLHQNGRFLLTNLRPGSHTISVGEPSKLSRIYAEHSFRVGNRNLTGMVIRLRTRTGP